MSVLSPVPLPGGRRMTTRKPDLSFLEEPTATDWCGGKSCDENRSECAQIIAAFSAIEVMEYRSIGGHVRPKQLEAARHALFLREMETLALRVAAGLQYDGLKRRWEGAAFGGSAYPRQKGPPLGFHPDRRTREHRIVPHASHRRQGTAAQRQTERAA